MTKLKRGLLLAALPLVASGGVAWADDAVDFGIFWGTVLAIEDKCENYFVRPDAVMGNHLSAKDYEFAKAMVDDERAKAARVVDKIGCDEAAKEAAKLSGKSFFKVWEID